MDSNQVNFDDFAEEYRTTHNDVLKITGENSDYYSEFKILKVLEHYDYDQKIKILDFGCGDGNSSKYFSQHFQQTEIEGIDVSKESINLAQKKEIKNATFQTFDGVNIPFENELFDIVFVSMVFHHIPFDLHKSILEEIGRVLKKGGELFIFEHNPKNFLTRKIVRDCVFDKDAVLLEGSYFKKEIQKANFQKVTLNYLLFLPRFKILKFFLGLEKMMKKIPFGAQYFIKAVK